MPLYHVIDAYARSYYEGQTFASREAAVAAARRIPEQDRPFGVWVVADDEADAGEEIIAPMA